MSKNFCSIAVLGVSFTWQIVKTRVTRSRVIEGPNASNQIAFHAFHSFLVEVQMNAVYIHAKHVITTWRLGLRVPLVFRNYAYTCTWRHEYWIIFKKKHFSGVLPCGLK